MEGQKNDFSKGSVVGNILRLALPMTLAQLINVLYNIVDRIYIGMIPENATLSLTGLGLCLPIISMVAAFANLFGMGGAPLCSIERGRGNVKEAEAIMGNSFVLMVLVGIALTVLRPAGTALIDGSRLDVVTSGEYIDAGATVEVILVEGSRIVVRESKNSDKDVHDNNG